jgi:hypothetical protein
VTTDSKTAWCGPAVAVRSSRTTGIPEDASHSRVRALVDASIRGAIMSPSTPARSTSRESNGWSSSVS